MPIERLPESVHPLYAELLVHADRPADLRLAWRHLEPRRRKHVLAAAERLEPEARERLVGITDLG